jgi:hypothetical protein
MEAIELRSWKGYADAFARVYKRVRPLGPREVGPQPLFRGQTDATWNLTTTLERYPGTPKTYRRYWETMNQVIYPLTAYTGGDWARSTEEEYRDWQNSALADTHFMNVPGYDLMVHLRHHGFPSPLLDWTRSPWIALYFAFRNVESQAAKVAVFAYLESVSGVRVGAPGGPRVHLLGPFVGTHRRHFLQQCTYTVCASHDDAPPDWSFQRHDAALSGPPRENQDLLWKIEMPATDRSEVLRYLEDYNLSAYSLFTSEEALMETLAATHFFLGKRI